MGQIKYTDRIQMLKVPSSDNLLASEANRTLDLHKSEINSYTELIVAKTSY